MAPVWPCPWPPATYSYSIVLHSRPFRSETYVVSMAFAIKIALCSQCTRLQWRIDPRNQHILASPGWNVSHPQSQSHYSYIMWCVLTMIFAVLRCRRTPKLFIHLIQSQPTSTFDTETEFWHTYNNGGHTSNRLKRGAFFFFRRHSLVAFAFEFLLSSLSHFLIAMHIICLRL